MDFDYRDYAVELVEEGVISADIMITALLKYLSQEDVAEMLHMNEMSPSLSCAEVV
jgi:hypothetical protein